MAHRPPALTPSPLHMSVCVCVCVCVFAGRVCGVFAGLGNVFQKLCSASVTVPQCTTDIHFHSYAESGINMLHNASEYLSLTYALKHPWFTLLGELIGAKHKAKHAQIVLQGRVFCPLLDMGCSPAFVCQQLFDYPWGRLQPQEWLIADLLMPAGVRNLIYLIYQGKCDSPTVNRSFDLFPSQFLLVILCLASVPGKLVSASLRTLRRHGSGSSCEWVTPCDVGFV